MATVVRDDDMAMKFSEILEKAKIVFSKKLWNGEFKSSRHESDS